MQQRRGSVCGPYRHRRQFRVDVRAENGERRPCLFATEREALVFIQETRAQLGIRLGVTVQEAIDEYERYLRDDKGNKPKSVGSTIQRLGTLMKLCLNAELRRIKADRCQDLYDALTARLAVDSHRNYLAETKTWLRWCIERGWIAKSPMEGVKGVGRRVRGKDQLRLDEARRFSAAAFDLADLHDGPVAALCALWLGMRASEIVDRKVRDLDDEGRLMWIPSSKTKAGRRMLVVPEAIRPLLLEVAEGKQADDWLFSSHKREWVLDWVKRLCRAAGVPEVTCHGLRGTYASIAIGAGGSGRDVAQSMGHVNEYVTKAAYAKQEAYDLAQNVRIKTAFDVLRARGGTDGGTNEGPGAGGSGPSGTSLN